MKGKEKFMCIIQMWMPPLVSSTLFPIIIFTDPFSMMYHDVPTSPSRNTNEREAEKKRLN